MRNNLCTNDAELFPSEFLFADWYNILHIMALKHIGVRLSKLIEDSPIYTKNILRSEMSIRYGTTTASCYDTFLN